MDKEEKWTVMPILGVLYFKYMTLLSVIWFGLLSLSCKAKSLVCLGPLGLLFTESCMDVITKELSNNFLVCGKKIRAIILRLVNVGTLSFCSIFYMISSISLKVLALVASLSKAEICSFPDCN